MTKKKRLKNGILCLMCCMGLVCACGKEKNVGEIETDKIVENVVQQTRAKLEEMPVPTEAKPEIDHSMYYIYYTLTGEERELYDDLYACITQHKEKIEVRTTSPDELDKIYRSLMAENGDLFWVNGYQYTAYSKNGTIELIEFEPHYNTPKEACNTLKRQIEQQEDELLEGITRYDTDYEKAKKVFESIIDWTEYDENAPESQSLISVILYKRSVCQGYSEAMQHMLKRLGIRSFVVIGEAEDEVHSWIAAELDGNWYYIDPTWGDAQYVNNAGDNVSYTDYEYLNKTLNDIKKTHKEDGLIVLPESNSVSNNYFVQENLYMETADPDMVGNICRSKIMNGEHEIILKCSEEGVMDRIIDNILRNGRIVDYINEIESYSYTKLTDDTLLIVL